MNVIVTAIVLCVNFIVKHTYIRIIARMVSSNVP